MIAYLCGIIMRKTDRAIVLGVNGVGYLVYVPQPLLMQLRVNEETVVHVHTSVTENDIVLYGFASEDECTFFEQLISISGIGSKTALHILSKPIALIRKGILTEDKTLLSTIPGIGRKTAERMIIELKEKIAKSGAAAEGADVHIAAFNTEALDALLSLGFSRYEAVSMLAHVPADIQDTQEMIQSALKQR